MSNKTDGNPLPDVKLYLDNDLYVCFDDEIDGQEIFWTMYYNGWVAVANDWDVYHTDEASIPTGEDRIEAAARAARSRRKEARRHLLYLGVPLKIQIGAEIKLDTPEKLVLYSVWLGRQRIACRMPLQEAMELVQSLLEPFSERMAKPEPRERG